jgi:hypothetical protein
MSASKKFVALPMIFLALATSFVSASSTTTAQAETSIDEQFQVTPHQGLAIPVIW